jgi:Defence against restriction A C-terminal
LAPYIDSDKAVEAIVQGFKDEMGGSLKEALDSLRNSDPDQWYNLFHKFSYKISPFFSDKKIEDIYKDAHRSLAQMASGRARGSRALSIEELMTAAAKAKAGQGQAANPSAPPSAKSRPAGEHRYGLRNRPPDYGAVPRGFLRVDPVDRVYPEQTRHGVIVYGRPLSKEEIRSYELVPYMDSDEVVEFISSRLIEEAGDDLDEVLELMADGGEGYADESFWNLTEDIRPFFSDKKTLEIFKLAREKLLSEHQ